MNARTVFSLCKSGQARGIPRRTVVVLQPMMPFA
jgi:hypothetical protein